MRSSVLVSDKAMPRPGWPAEPGPGGLAAYRSRRGGAARARALTEPGEGGPVALGAAGAADAVRRYTCSRNN